MIDPFTHPGAAPRIFQETAWCLVGRPVSVLFSSNGLGERLGEFIWEDPENSSITVRPGLTEELTYRAFLHECAHARLDWPFAGKPDKDLTKRIERAMNGADRGLEADRLKNLYGGVISRMENAADELAARWDEAAVTALGHAAPYTKRLEWLRNASYQNPFFVEYPPATAEEGQLND